MGVLLKLKTGSPHDGEQRLVPGQSLHPDLVALQAGTKTTLAGQLGTAVAVLCITGKRVLDATRCRRGTLYAPSILFICHGRVVVRESGFDDSQGQVSPSLVVRVDALRRPDIMVLMGL